MIDHPILQAVADHLSKNWEAYTAFIAAVGVAGVCTMPKTIPASVQDCWTWLRDTLQTAVPAARAAHQVSVETTETPALKTVKATETETPKEP